MVQTTRIPHAELTGVQGRLLKLLIRRKFGKVPDSVAVMWNHPAVFKDLMKWSRSVEKWDQLEPGLASLAVMATAAEIGCGFCLDLNYFLAHDHGLDETKARDVPRWREAEVFTDLERQVMAYAEAMCQTPPTVDDELAAALLAELGAAGVLELTARVGMMNLMARSNVALGIRSEHFADSCALPPLAHRAALGSNP